jgi:hypothetical protein
VVEEGLMFGLWWANRDLLAQASSPLQDWGLLVLGLGMGLVGPWLVGELEGGEDLVCDFSFFWVLGYLEF